MTRMQELYAELTNSELVDGIRDLEQTVNTYQTEYDATDPDDLETRGDVDDDRLLE